MIAPSTRYVPVLLVLMVILLVPVLRARLDPRRVDDCARPEALQELRRVPGTGTVVERWEKYGPDVPQWTEAELQGNDGQVTLRAALIRSFDPVFLYARPPRLLLGRLESAQRQVQEVEVDGVTLPLQTIYDASGGRNAMASYLFVYGNEPVEHPFVRQLWTAPAQVWEGGRPLSLLMVAGIVPPERRAQARERAQQWLVAAWRFHQAACR